jgi:Ni/Fe-hydrogenase subunit HybB-like protein
MFIRETFFYLLEINLQSVMFYIEILIGVALPLWLFLSKKVLASPNLLLISSSLVVFGVLINRINNFIIAYKPPFADYSYIPSYGEISVTLGFVAILVLLYRAFVMIFPIITIPNDVKKAEEAK